MATTLRAITELVLGVRTTTGTVVASGNCRFYSPGTLVAAVVYSDAAAASPYAQPVVTNAGGQAVVYTLEPVRMIVKDSTDTTTYIDQVINLNRHDSVYITHASVNGGVETTLENALTSLTTSLGANFQYLESAGATARAYSSWMGEAAVSVMDFGATGDGSTDDTVAIQAACDRVEARGGGKVRFPKGTYKTTAAITIDTAGVSLEGTGRAGAIVKNFGTTTNAFTINLGSAVDSKITIKDLAVTANTTSSGAAFTVTNGDRIVFDNVSTALHRTGFSTSAVTGARYIGCVVASTDDNAAAVGITAGPRGRVTDCEVISGTDNGTGITLAADARARGCYVSNFAVGYLLSGLSSRADDCDVNGATTGVSITGAGGSSFENGFATGCTTGVSLGANYARCQGAQVTSCTTGISAGAVTSPRIVGNILSSNTTDIGLDTGATDLQEHSNSYSTITATLFGQKWASTRAPVHAIAKQTSSAAAPTFTPDPAYTINVCEGTHTAAGSNYTLAATATTNLVDGQIMYIVFQKTGANNMAVSAINAQYSGYSGSTINSATYNCTAFVWRTSSSKWLQINNTGGVFSSTSW